LRSSVWFSLTIAISSNKQIKIFHVKFEVLTAVVKKNSVFWDVTPCSTLTTKDNAALYSIGQNSSKYFLVMSYIQINYPERISSEGLNPTLGVSPLVKH
jgi:hypothetical protein